jgi:hypothetical protein
MTDSVKNILNFLVRFALSGALLVYLFSRMDMDKTVEVVKSSDPLFIILAAGTFLILHFFILIRWVVFIRALNLDAPFITIMRYFFIGLFGNLFLPTAIGGDVIKILGLCKDSSQKPKVVASVLVDRLSGFAGMIVVATIAFGFGYQLIGDTSVLFSIAALTILSILVVLILFNERIYSFGCRAFTKFPRLKNGLMTMHYDIALLRGRMSAIYNAVGLSVLGQIILAFTFFLTAKALHQDIPMIYFLIFVPLICVAAAMPSIGGLGVREAGAAFFFAKVGVDAGIAVSISLINFLFMVMVGLIGGIVYVSTVSPGRVQHYSPAPGPGPERF